MELTPDNGATHPYSKVDVPAILGAVWPAAALCLIVVLLLALLGEWRTILLTPLAWLLAIPVARRCVHASRNSRTTLLLTEATVAGALLGLALAGIALSLIYLVSPYRNPASAILVIVLSTLAPAFIARAVARRSLRRDQGSKAAA